MPPRDIWQALDESPHLWKAVSAAFALVSASDGEVDEKELIRFREWLGKHARREDVQAAALADFDALTRDLLEDFAAGQKKARDRIREVTEPSHRNLVLSAARTAIVADLRIDDREELVMRHVSELLGMAGG